MTSTNENTRRILLVEDEKAIRDAVAAYLERENYWVTAVGDAAVSAKAYDICTRYVWYRKGSSTGNCRSDRTAKECAC